MANTSVSIQDKSSQRRVSVVPTLADPTKNGLVICNPDGSKISTDLSGYAKLTDLQNFELELARKLSSNSYMEYTEVGGNITQVNYWTDSGKGTKLFTKDITYSGNNPTQIVMKDEITNTVLTTTIAYSGNTITNIIKVLS